MKFKKGYNWLQWKRFILLKIYIALACLSVWVNVSLSAYKKWKGGAKIGSVIHLIDKPSSLLVDKPSKPILPWLQIYEGIIERLNTQVGGNISYDLVGVGAGFIIFIKILFINGEKYGRV